ncbi:CHAP domain-containing protein [Flavobacterium sp. NKUCC04_CG]|uniref:CHAP domain-containing protein n=1 Tax=Flavobacterium sp. NKUCC04_CG TaxID=2842121 RepID=UPI001C5B0A02|nr:CHAP domain-containing protein [Flavobacterium sp. NKUCC04_CG]MBW3520393.1 CHAP domain-containing protein [Flavobacterium sp. NKUCC04_CG]
MSLKKIVVIFVLVGALIVFGVQIRKTYFYNPDKVIGQAIDSLKGVRVYYNGGVNHVGKRNLTVDNYNLGLEYQCVEFVKRYYFERFQHRMPDSYGNAKDFFDQQLADGEVNKKRALLQFKNPSVLPPETDDLLVYSPTIWNRFGHVAIVAAVYTDSIEIIQQNPGPNAATRERYALRKFEGKWQIDNSRIYGWLRVIDENNTEMVTQ